MELRLLPDTLFCVTGGILGGTIAKRVSKKNAFIKLKDSYDILGA